MKALHYAGGVVVTGDALADAVVHFAESLARKGTSTAVDLPARLPNGQIASVSLLLGPASQLVAVPEPGDVEEIVDDDLVASLNRSAALLGDPKPVSGDDVRHFDTEFDLP